jgi:DNA-binding XRE family transcriptional regulator
MGSHKLSMTLRRLRQAKGLSQDALARKASITRECINKLEAGRYELLE